MNKLQVLISCIIMSWMNLKDKILKKDKTEKSPYSMIHIKFKNWQNHIT